LRKGRVLKNINLFRISSTKLAIAQVVLGLLIIGSFFAFVNWVSNGYNVYEGTIAGSDIIVRVFLNPGRVPLYQVWSLIYLGLGVVVTGCGIAQLIKSRREGTG
jgi:hypothetical protein